MFKIPGDVYTPIPIPSSPLSKLEMPSQDLSLPASLTPPLTPLYLCLPLTLPQLNIYLIKFKHRELQRQR